MAFWDVFCTYYDFWEDIIPQMSQNKKKEEACASSFLVYESKSICLLVELLHAVLDDDALVRLRYTLTCYVVDWSVAVFYCVNLLD